MKKMTKINVIIKIRPRTKIEIDSTIKVQWSVDRNTIKTRKTAFNFDNVIGPNQNNRDVYECVNRLVEMWKHGQNGSILSYGQKSSGKTYTMMGTDDDPGVAILAIHELFKESPLHSTRQFVIRVGYIEIFNEVLYDLLNRRQIVHIGRHEGSDVKLSNKEVIVKDKETIFKLLQKGNDAKTPRAPNDAPSASHTIFQIIIESQENSGPVQVSCLNLVDLDRADRVKSEQGTCGDKSLEYLRLAIEALSKGEKFHMHSKSKLTRLLRLGMNANTALICNVTPTSLNQTTNTLSFANDAKEVETKATLNQLDSDASIIYCIRSEIVRLKQLKADLEPLLRNSSTVDDEISDMESIFLMEKEMRPKVRTNIFEQQSTLKIRPFFANLNAMDKKYQIGEMVDQCVDAQSRIQRKSNAFKWSEYFLERVGFEINTNMRRDLKYGKNIIGRSDVDVDVDICIDSLECSRKHCCITVSEDCSRSVVLEDLNVRTSSNGTTINGIKYKNKTVELHETDVISIVGGGKNVTALVGNYDCTVYRLRKSSTSDKMQTYVVDDDVVIEIDDDDDDDDDDRAHGDDVTSCVPVKMELDTIQPAECIEINDEDDDNDAGTSYAPVKMELEPAQPESCIEINDEDDDNDAGTSYAPVKMELETPQPISFVEVETAGKQATTSNSENVSSSDPKQGDEFDLDDFIIENATYENLEEINVTPIVILPKHLERDLEDFSIVQRYEQLNRDYESNKKMFAEQMEKMNGERAQEIKKLKDEFDEQIKKLNCDNAEQIEKINGAHVDQIKKLNFEFSEQNKKLIVESADEIKKLKIEFAGQTKKLNSELVEKIKKLNAVHTEHCKKLNAAHAHRIEKLDGDLNVIKKANDSKKDVIIDLQSKLLVLTQDKNSLTEDNSNMSSSVDKYVEQINLLTLKLRAAENDRDSLREKNIKHINELMDHFDGANGYKKPKLDPS